MNKLIKVDSREFLNAVPVRAVEHELKNGTVVLLRPKYVKGFLGRYLQPRLRAKFFRVRLDDMGSAMWTAIDGTKTLGQIADILREKFGDDIEPRYERCSRFIFSLYQGAMIGFEPEHGPKEK